MFEDFDIQADEFENEEDYEEFEDLEDFDEIPYQDTTLKVYSDLGMSRWYFY